MIDDDDVLHGRGGVNFYPLGRFAAKKMFRGSIRQMRTSLRILLALIVGTMMNATAKGKSIPVYIGTAGNPDADTAGIYLCRFDTDTGALT
jgi:hypothetical protein